MRQLGQIIERFFGPTRPTSRQDAKQRLKFLLIHDQVDLTPGQLDLMRSEILEVIHRYLDIEDDGVEFKLAREDGQVALISNIPVRRVTARAS